MYCKNCGKEMNEYGICTNCGWRYSAVQTRQIPKRKNTLPIVYIIVVGLITILLLISNWGNGLSAETIGLEAKGGSIWYLLYGMVMYAPAYFLLQRKKLRWCALFLFLTSINSVMLLFMGLSIRKDYDLLLLERKQKN